MPTIDHRRLRHIIDVIAVLVSRDQKSRYRSTAMGIVWAVASPLLFLLIFYFLFAVVLPLGIANYASYVLVGVVAWTWLQTGVNDAVNSIPWNAGLVNQPRFPVAALPVVSVLSNFVTFLMTFPILLVLVWTGAAGPGLPYLALPLVMAAQFLFVLALAYAVAALNVTFRDMRYIVPILLQLGYFLTPIFYDLGMVSGGARRILDLNPMLHIVGAYRAILVEGRWPDWGPILAVLAGSAILLALALRHFRASSYRFLEEL
ncbi:MAG: ABC transporter permease [Pseudomonadota bacterium]